MRPIYLIAILSLLIGAAYGQLSPDKERFDVKLHPGEVVEKTLTLKNVGDTPISKISKTPVSGDAKDLIFVNIPDGKTLEPQEKGKINIFFIAAPETKPGHYTGSIYLLDSAPPSMPVAIEFYIDVIEPQSYDIDLSINDARTASAFAKSDEAADFDVLVTNLGKFRDVVSVDIPALPEGWTVSLLDGDKEVPIPYDIPLNPGISHPLKLGIESSNPGENGKVIVEATSLGNSSKNATAEASAEFGIAVRGYNVKIDLPEKMVPNRTYEGSFSIALQVKEQVTLGVLTPDDLMVIPLIQVAAVNPDSPGVANFTILALKPGEYPVVFKLADSKGVRMPDEIAAVDVVEPNGTAILTGEDLIYKTIASLCHPKNITLPVISVPGGILDKKARENLFTYSKVVILGNESVISKDAEKELKGIDLKRINGSLCEISWRLISEMWQNGTPEVILSSPEETQIFKAYREAEIRNIPMAVCGGNMTDATKSVISNLTKRNTKLTKVLLIGNISEDNKKALTSMGISIEEVKE